MFIGWVVLTIVGGAKALQGDDWKNPVKNVVKLEVLSERERAADLDDPAATAGGAAGRESMRVPPAFARVGCEAAQLNRG